MSMTDAPIPLTPEAKFNKLINNILTRISRLERKPQTIFVITVTGTTDASGFITFTHNAGQIPSGIFIEAQAPISGTIAAQHLCDSYTITTARARFFQQTGAIFASTSVTFKAFIFVSGTEPLPF